METRVNNLNYEHRHGKYRWHLRTVKHRKMVEQPSETDVCIICNAAKKNMQFDEFLGGNICDLCANNQEILTLSK